MDWDRPKKLSKGAKKAKKRAKEHAIASAKAREDYLSGKLCTTWPTPITSGEPKWVDPTPPKTEQELVEERVKEALTEWPWKGLPEKLIAIAPYTFNQNAQFSLPQAKQTSRLFKEILPNTIFRQIIINSLFKHHDAAWKFSATCREAWDLMRFEIDTWDMTKGYFYNCDLPRFGDGAPKDPFDQGVVAPILMVTPVRQAEGRISYEKQIQHLKKFCLSVNHFAGLFRNLQLHRIPFLTTDILALLIPQMTNLEVLGIYNCKLIHVGEAMKLLDIIKADRPLEKENQVALDFFPNFHLGPIEKYGSNGNEYFAGSYGVTWDNWDYPTDRAVWCLVPQILTKARSQGVDFESKHTMFRQWLEMGPCLAVGETIKALMTPTPKESEEVISIKEKLAELKKQKDVSKTKRQLVGKKLRENLKKAEMLDMDKHQRKAAAMVNYRRTLGDIRRLKQCNRPGGTDWAITRHQCDSCKEKLMGIFFSYQNLFESSITEFDQAKVCLGCMLQAILRKERDHYKQHKRNIIKTWLQTPEGPNKDDLMLALSEYELRDIEGRARRLDHLHLKESTTSSDPYDKEYDERQVSIPWEELNNKRGTQQRSPTIYDTLPGQADGIDTWRTERYDGHGMFH